MEWNLLAVIVAASTVVSSLFSTLALRHARRESERLASVGSANLVMKLRGPWAKGKFKQFLSDARKNNELRGREGEIESFLNRMETIAMFMEQKTLNEVHVKELFAENFKMIKSNCVIREYYNNAREKNEKYTFTNIARVLEKIEAWDV